MKHTISFYQWLAASFIIFLFIGCATQQKYKANLNTWLGHDINEMINSWGYPSSSFKAPNGNTVYVYDRSWSETKPMTVYTTKNSYLGDVTTVSPSETITHGCTTYIETDNQETIIRWSFKGDRCVAQ